MKNVRTGWAAALIVGGALLATPALSMEHGHSGHGTSAGMSHGEMQSMENGQGGMIMLGEEVKDGVKAEFQLMPLDPTVLPPGHAATHHLMVMFKDVAGRKAAGSGTVAAKIASPDGSETAPIQLTGMQGHYGADVNLDKPGIWHFRVATRLADGKVRQYHSHHVVK